MLFSFQVDGGHMNSREENVFYQPRLGTDEQYERNVVKHLFTVLARSRNDVTEAVVRELLNSEVVAEVQPGEILTYDLEVTPDGEDADVAHVVGIANHPSDQSTRLDSEDIGEDVDNRADGIIRYTAQDDSTRLAVIIEAKTGSDWLSEEQLKRYKLGFNAESISRSLWRDVQQVLNRNRPEVNRSSTVERAEHEGSVIENFLLQQFVEFLQNEEIRGVVAQDIRHEIKGTDAVSQRNEVLVRCLQTNEEGDKTVEVRFISWWRDDPNETFKKYYSPWLSQSEFEDLFGQIGDKEDTDDIRERTFVGVDDGSGSPTPDLSILLEWAKDGGFGPDGDLRWAPDEFAGSHSKVVAEITDREGNHPELRIKDGNSLRFSRLTPAKNPNIQRPAHYAKKEEEERYEFRDLIAAIDDPNVRRRVFVDLNLKALWEYYTKGD